MNTMDKATASILNQILAELKEVRKQNERIEARQLELLKQGERIEVTGIEHKECIGEVSGKVDEVLIVNKTKEETGKVNASKTDIKTFIKNGYIENPDFFREYVTEEEEKTIIGGIKKPDGKVKDPSTIQKRMATAIWDACIKGKPDRVDYYRNLKTIKEKGIVSDTPEDEDDEKALPTIDEEPEAVPVKKAAAPKKAAAAPKKAAVAPKKATAPKKVVASKKAVAVAAVKNESSDEEED